MIVKNVELLTCLLLLCWNWMLIDVYSNLGGI